MPMFNHLCAVCLIPFIGSNLIFISFLLPNLLFYFASKSIFHLDDKFHEIIFIFNINNQMPTIYNCSVGIQFKYRFYGSYHMVARSWLPIPAHFIERMPFWILEYDNQFFFLSFISTFNIQNSNNAMIFPDFDVHFQLDFRIWKCVRWLLFAVCLDSFHLL